MTIDWDARIRVPISIVVVALLMLLMPGPAQSRQDDPRLEALFATLQETGDPSVAGKAMTEISDIWFDAGDERVNRFMSKGRSAMAGREFAQALANFDQAIAIDPEYAEAWNQRATLYYFIGNLEASIRDAEQTLALEPRYFGALSGLGLIHIRAGELQKAIAWFERAIAVNPHARNARTNIDGLKQRLQEGVREN
jgi:tetratricopeptide (TPR) repeat protein